MNSSMMKCTAALVLAAASTFGASNGRPPKVAFGAHGVTITDVRPGTPIAWMALIRERRDHYDHLRILRGFGPAAAQARMEIAREGADAERAIWVVADVESGASVRAVSPRMTASERSIVVRAAAGGSAVVIESVAADVLYVRPRQGAWVFKSGDGGARDGDRSQNGAIVVPLTSMARFKGHPHPPQTVAAGDVILIIDPRMLRTAAVEVKQ